MRKKKDFAWLGRGIAGAFLGAVLMVMPPAVFASAGVPTIQIAPPVQNTTNGLLTVSGNAGGNAGVAAVYHSLNGGLWTTATTTNNWTNWCGNVVLTPGTNIFKAYALSTSGQVSSTNAVKCFYKVLMPMSVAITGNGNLTPNDNGKLLAVNQGYALTASPGPGFRFTNWTDGLGNVLTNRATLQFTMTTNLALTAHFVDNQKPTVKILSPTPLQPSPWPGTGVPIPPQTPVLSVAQRIIAHAGPQNPPGLAGSAPNVPFEYWIATNATGNFFTNATHYSGGTADNPLDGSTQPGFDFNLSNMPANSVVHLLPGTYQTLGNSPLGWGLKDNQRILGSGTDNTVLQHPAWEVTNHALIDGFFVVGGVYNGGPPTNVDLEDFTVDGNYYRSNYVAGDYAVIKGIHLRGSYNTVRNVRVINLAAYAPTNSYKEAWGIAIDPYNGCDHNLVENCEVSHFTATNYCNLCAISIGGGGVITNNLVVQEDPRDTIYAIQALSGSINGNVTVGCTVFSLINNENENISNLVISNNSILYSPCGITWRNASASNVRILNNFFVMTNSTPPWASGSFISCVTLKPDNASGAAHFYNVQFSGNTVQTVSSGALGLSLFDATGGVGLNISGNAIDCCFSNRLTGCANVVISGNYVLNGNNLSVTGSAGDNVGVAAVYCSVNGGLWTNASTTDNWVHWAGSAMLTPGTNTLQSYAVDAAGNVSATNTVQYVYAVPSPLTVSINGNGAVTPNNNGRLLLVNVNYALTATAGTGCVFTNWTDGLGNVLTNRATLQFTMTTNLALTAHFVDNQKPTVKILSPTPLQPSPWPGTGVPIPPQTPVLSVAQRIIAHAGPQNPPGLAGSAPNVPFEYWIATNATGNFFTNATHYSGGTADNPLDGSTQPGFDFNLSNMPANSVVHLLPGTYQTLGNSPLGWGLKDNQRILGSGTDNTVLQHPAWEVTNHALIDGFFVVGGVYNGGPPTNVDLEDFTVDGNYYRSNYVAGDYAVIKGIHLRGSYNTVRNVRVINLAAYAPTNSYKEAWGIAIDPYNGCDHNLIENCEVSHFTATNYCDLSAISIWGGGVITNNLVVQEDPRDTIYAIQALSGSINGNVTVGCATFSYMDNGSNNVSNLVISNNSILYSPCGITWRNASASNVRILNNFFVMTNSTPPWASGSFISCVTLKPDNASGAAHFYNVQFSGNTVQTVSSGALGLSLFDATGGVGLNISGNAIDCCFSNRLTGCANVVISGNYVLNGNNLSVTGSAGDNVGVAAVYCSVNGGLWTNASTTDNWVHWAGSAMLTPGTNTLQSYAVDAAGNVSATNTVQYVYAVPSPLTVSINGNGAVTPNNNGRLLLVNVNYALTATAGTGCVFTNWTDGLGNVLTNRATLQFTMTTNLALTAHFVDVQKPTLTIVAPVASQKLTSEAFTLMGRAGDNVGVAAVYFSLNGSPWTSAATVNNWTNWTGSVTLAPGTNTLQVYAADTGGNLSATNTVKFVCVLPGPRAAYGTEAVASAPAWLVPTIPGNGRFALAVSGTTNRQCIVQASTNLVDWVSVETNTIPFTYVDVNAGQFNQQFYRTVYIQ